MELIDCLIWITNQDDLTTCIGKRLNNRKLDLRSILRLVHDDFRKPCRNGMADVFVLRIFSPQYMASE